jgi:hypothetical protein
VRRRWKALRQRLAELASPPRAPARTLAAVAVAGGDAGSRVVPLESHPLGH